MIPPIRIFLAVLIAAGAVLGPFTAELSAQNMPRGFPLDQVESAVDYDYVFIGEGKYLLPIHSEALSCGRAASQCSRNVIEFRNYKKFTADTSITFEPDK